MRNTPRPLPPVVRHVRIATTGFLLVLGALAVRAQDEGTFAPLGVEQADRPASVPYPVRLTTGMDCWGNDGAKHPLPDRVIYRRSHGWHVGRERMVGLALDQMFNGVDHGLEVYKFCTRPTLSAGAR